MLPVTPDPTIGTYLNRGEDVIQVQQVGGSQLFRIDGAGDLNMAGDANLFNGLPLVSHGFPSQVATFDVTNAQAAYTNQALYTTPSNQLSNPDPSNNYSGFYEILWSAKVITPGSVGSVLGGGGGLQLTYNAADDGVSITTPGNAISGNNGNTTGTNGNGRIAIFAKAGTAITFSFGYSTTGTNMIYSLHLRVADY